MINRISGLRVNKWLKYLDMQILIKPRHVCSENKKSRPVKSTGLSEAHEKPNAYITPHSSMNLGYTLYYYQINQNQLRSSNAGFQVKYFHQSGNMVSVDCLIIQIIGCLKQRQRLMYIINLIHSLESGFLILPLLSNVERTKIFHTKELVCIKMAIQVKTDETLGTHLKCIHKNC